MKLRFTLIEIVVALAILGVSLAGLLQLSVSSQLRVAAARDRYDHTHMLTQAAEYLLLNPMSVDREVPDEYFPYTGYRVEQSFDDVTDLPEELLNLDDQIELKAHTIKIIRTGDGKCVAEVTVDRFDYESVNE